MFSRTTYIVSICLLAASLLLFGGCAEKKSPEPEAPAPTYTAAQQNYMLGHQLVAAGRFELAREHLLMALASAEEDDFKLRITTDLAAVDRMLRTTR